jgi:hypothetical protein
MPTRASQPCSRAEQKKGKKKKEKRKKKKKKKRAKERDAGMEAPNRENKAKASPYYTTLFLQNKSEKQEWEELAIFLIQGLRWR